MSSANPSPQCDLSAGWTPFGSNCYKFKADARKTWNAARHDCVQEGGDLVSIVNTEEQQFLLGQLDNSMLDPWIGFSTLVRGNEKFKFVFVFFYTIFLIIMKHEDEFFFLLQTCTQISCQVTAGNTQFKWSDSVTASYTNWATGEPTV